MQLKPVIRAQQKQSLIITPQLQQAIKLLQMTNLEIRAFLEEQALENPFLDVRDANADKDSAADARDMPDQAEPADHDMPRDVADMTPGNNALQDDPTAHADLDNRYSSLENMPARSAFDGEAEDMMARLANPDDGLHAMVLRQIDLAIDPGDRAIAYMLTDLLSPTGWLDQPLDEIAASTSISLERLEEVLNTLQELEPAGIFARSLSECLALQAKDNGEYDQVMATVLDHIELLGKGEIAALARLADCSQDDILDTLRLIRSYNPKPGESYSNDLPPLGEPDVLVRQTKDGWAVELNRSTLPTIHIRENYAKDIEKTLERKRDENSSDFIGTAIGSARWLKRALEQRNMTTMKICAEIIRLQQDFMNHGLDALKPMSLKTIAEAVGMHESTISRVTNGTVIHTPRGTYSLKSFFSVSIATDDGDEGMAATAVRNKIKSLIEAESPNKPLSDNDIAEAISDQGITLARRTVAKYREMMRIPSSSERRRLARMKMIG
ncbi:RNA polymerase factor sigma-54 [Alphaproteobacteria bacterium LSUCC0684]